MKEFVWFNILLERKICFDSKRTEIINQILLLFFFCLLSIFYFFILKQFLKTDGKEDYYIILIINKQVQSASRIMSGFIMFYKAADRTLCVMHILHTITAQITHDKLLGKIIIETTKL